MLLVALCVTVLSVTIAPDAKAISAGAFWSCVPFARQVSDISLSGDAWQWWTAAAGTYARGHTPREGSVLVFKRTSTLRQGHVAVVRKVLGNRRILVDHANWDRGRRKGRVDRSVGILDVSPKNDWSQVRVWYTPVGDFGTTHYPTHGFIYSKATVLPDAPPMKARVIPVSLPKPKNVPVPVRGS
ncbi:MAG: CHAP domain-containing protein [Rhodospirillaceae bacterium]